TVIPIGIRLLPGLDPVAAGVTLAVVLDDDRILAVLGKRHCRSSSARQSCLGPHLAHFLEVERKILLFFALEKIVPIPATGLGFDFELGVEAQLRKSLVGLS